MKLFKRKFLADGKPDPESTWYCRFMVKGRIYVWSTKTTHEKTAQKNAAGYREAIKSKQFNLANSMKERNGIPSFRSLFDQYMEMPLGVERASRLKNVSGMRFLLDASGISETESADKLGRAMVIKFQTKALAAKVPATTINSRLRSARSLFSARATMSYVPQVPKSFIEDFKMVPALPEDERRPDLPSDEAMALAHTQLPAIPTMYRAFLLGAYAGLRSGEIAAARYDWIENGVLYVGGREFAAKSGKWRTVGLAPDVLAHLAAPADRSTFIAGEGANLTVKRQLAPMLRALGFTARNPVHSLRRYYGSMVATASGLYAAQTVLGHSSPATTAKAYARLLNIPAAVSITPLPAVSA